MSSAPFSFPPPPPPPPSQSSQSLPSHSNINFSGPRGGIWNGASGGRGQHGKKAPMGKYQGVPGNIIQSDAANNQYYAGGYPLPSYPPVQQPRYPAHLSRAFDNSSTQYQGLAQPSVSYNPYSNPPHAGTHASSQLQNNATINCGQPNNSHAQTYHPTPQYSTFQIGQHGYGSPPVAMGPPIRMGFSAGHKGQSQQYTQPNQNSNQSTDLSVNRSSSQQWSDRGFSRGRRNSPNRPRGNRGRNHDRGLSNLSNGFSNPSRKTQVAPAVPSFGNPLPTKPPVAQVDAKRPKKKKRRQNQLGLTPKTEEHQSSSEEDDTDEEAKLVVSSGVASQQLEFTYKGRTSTLQSSSDIFAWLEERKKRFPTEARRIEKEKVWRKERKEKEAKRKVVQEARYLKKQEKAKTREAQDAITKAKLKVEKLRRQLKKEKRRAAQAEANASMQRPVEKNGTDGAQEKGKRNDGAGLFGNADDSNVLIKTGSLNTHNNLAEIEEVKATASTPMDEKKDMLMPSTLDLSEQQDDEVVVIPDPLTPTSQPPLSEQESELKPKVPRVFASPLTMSKTVTPRNDCSSQPAHDADLDIEDSSDMSMSTSSSELSSSSDEDSHEGDDTTLSNGSLSTDSSDGEGPETTTSARTRPDKASPPAKRETKLSSSVCRDWLRNGRCQRRHRCKWRHELVERGKGDPRTKGLSRSQRKSLHQRLVEQEIEKEKQQILALGEDTGVHEMGLAPQVVES